MTHFQCEANDRYLMMSVGFDPDAAVPARSAHREVRHSHASAGGRMIAGYNADGRLVKLTFTIVDPAQIDDELKRVAADMLDREVGPERSRVISREFDSLVRVMGHVLPASDHAA